MKLCMGCMEQYGEQYQVCPYCGYIEDTPAKESFQLEPGSILAKKYIVGKAIGYGGFGTTYIGFDYELKRKIAIKEYLPAEFSTHIRGEKDITIFPGDNAAQFHAGKDKFIEEAKKLLRFKAVPGIVCFYDCFEENETAYITMELLEGETLKNRMKREGKLPYPEAERILSALLEALIPVHTEGIIHRDIAPDNVFLTKDGKVKLIDFGASRYATTCHSRSMTVLIKEGFAPQEQYRSRGDQGPWTDVYSTAAVFYHMVTGRSLQDAMEREVKDLVKAPSKAGAAGVPKHVEIAVMNALNRKIEDRTKDCISFQEEFRNPKVKRRFIQQKRMDIGRWSLRRKLIGGGAFSAVIVFLILMATGVISFSGIFSVFQSQAGVPDVIGLKKEQAELTIQESGFKVQYANYIENENIPKDCIYNQSPGANVVQKKGDCVYLSISCGILEKKMIDAVGYDVSAIQEKLENLGLEVQKSQVSGEGAAGAAPGTVIRQIVDMEEIPEGTVINEGMVVTLEISEGAGDLIDPNSNSTISELIGQAFTDARMTAGENQYYVRKVAEEFSDSAEKGVVVKQQIMPGETVAQGTIVDLTVSKGNQIEVPFFIGKTLTEARELAQEQEIKLDIRYQKSETVVRNFVISQSADMGTTIHYQDSVIIYVSEGMDGLDVDDEALNDLQNNPSLPSGSRSQASDSRSTTRAVGQTDRGNENAALAEEAAAESVEEETPAEVWPESGGEASNNHTVTYVPNVSGMTLEEAVAALAREKLAAEITYAFSSSVSENRVISQGVAIGSGMEPGSHIPITVSKGVQAPSGWTTNSSFTGSKWYTSETRTVYRYYPYRKVVMEEKSSAYYLEGYDYVNAAFGAYTEWGEWSDWYERMLAPDSTELTEYEEQFVYCYTAYVCPVCKSDPVSNSGQIAACGHSATQKLKVCATSRGTLTGTYSFSDGTTAKYYTVSAAGGGASSRWYNEEAFFRYRKRSRKQAVTVTFVSKTATAWSTQPSSYADGAKEETRTEWRYTEK